MKKPKLIFRPDGGMTIDENDDDLFNRIPTPEELRAAEARLQASDVYHKERPFPDDPDKVEKEQKAQAKYDAAIAAINAQYEKEVKEKEKKG